MDFGIGTGTGLGLLQWLMGALPGILQGLYDDIYCILYYSYSIRGDVDDICLISFSSRVFVATVLGWVLWWDIGGSYYCYLYQHSPSIGIEYWNRILE